MAYTEHFELKGKKHAIVLEHNIEFLTKRFKISKGIIVGAIISSFEELSNGEKTIYDQDHQILIRLNRNEDVVTVSSIERPDVILDDLNVIKT